VHFVASTVMGREDVAGTSYVRDHLQNCSGLALEGDLSLCTALCVVLENCAFCAHCVLHSKQRLGGLGNGDLMFTVRWELHL
jgi:hypothetical protein